MNKRGPIVVIEDDMDDQEVLTMVFQELGCPNEIAFFKGGDEALDYLTQPDVFPFLVLCDINIPRMNGFEVKEKACGMDTLAHKCVPFLFYSTGPSDRHARDAYAQSVQGFFAKPASYDGLRATISVILQYWGMCYSPMQAQSAAVNTH